MAQFLAGALLRLKGAFNGGLNLKLGGVSRCPLDSNPSIVFPRIPKHKPKYTVNKTTAKIEEQKRHWLKLFYLKLEASAFKLQARAVNFRIRIQDVKAMIHNINTHPVNMSLGSWLIWETVGQRAWKRVYGDKEAEELATTKNKVETLVIAQAESDEEMEDLKARVEKIEEKANEEMEEPKAKVDKIKEKVQEVSSAPTTPKAAASAANTPPTSTTSSPPKAASATSSPPKAASATSSPPKKASATSSPPKKASSPPKAASATSSPPKAASATSSPPKAASATSSPPKKASAISSPPKKASATSSPPKEASTTSSPPKATSYPLRLGPSLIMCTSRKI